MDLVDYCSERHGAALAKVVDLLSWPHHCRLTGRTKETLITLRLSKGALLDPVRIHIVSRLPVYCEQQTMYDIDYAEKPTFGYVICPLYIGANKLYVKVILPAVARECDEHLIVSAHTPNSMPGEKK